MKDEFIDSEHDEDENTSSADENKSAISADLIRGHINTIILRTLYERDKYGYEIIEEIEAKSHGQYSLKQPTLYSALKRLESQGYINAYWKTDEVSQGGRRKYYTLTDSGREITERNQAEWEYSRTVIDNLISDRNFDFTQPPPAAVDFKILKSSTSRVPNAKDDESEAEGRVVNYDEPEKPQVVEIVREEVTVVTEKPAEAAEEPATRAVEAAIQPQDAQRTMSDEERRIVHENYLKLISEPVQEVKETQEMPYADSIDTEKLIYNNRPDTERDYRNLINNLFVKTVRVDNPPPSEAQEYAAPRVATAHTVKVDEAALKAENDGLTVGTSEYKVSSPRKKRYNRGSTLFKCSLIIAVIMLFEFALCLIFKNNLGVTLAYPFVIFAIACAQVLIFGVLCYTDMGKSSRKPTTLVYISACIIVSIIAIVIIFITSLLLDVNFAQAGDIMAKIVVPIFVTLNIPIFAGCFYFLSK